MNRPLLVTDCDEVLLHFINPFRGWADEVHGIEFELHHPDFFENLRRKDCGSSVPQEEGWAIFRQFFTEEMHRQHAAPGAMDALAKVSRHADVVVLTNLPDPYQQLRMAQLAGHGADYRVICNQGPKGPALARLIDELSPAATVFVDDLAKHHESVAEIAPQVSRLHMVIEPLLAAHVPPAPHAHARIDNWTDALPWIMERLEVTTVE